MTATVYERDNCVGDTTRKGKRNGERERGWDTKGLDSNLGLGFSFFLKETLSKTGQKWKATVYDRDNCVGDTTRKGKRKKSNGDVLTVHQCWTRVPFRCFCFY